MNDERFYAEVVNELKLHGPVPGLWAKAYAEANGNKQQAEALYLRYRAEQIAEANRERTARPNGNSDDLKSLYADVSGNFAAHAPYLLVILFIIVGLVFDYFH